MAMLYKSPKFDLVIPEGIIGDMVGYMLATARRRDAAGSLPARWGSWGASREAAAGLPESHIGPIFKSDGCLRHPRVTAS